MGRRRRRIYKPIKKKIPRIFGCPKCGSLSIRVVKQNKENSTYYYKVVCGNEKCGIIDNITTSHQIDLVDVYNIFVDDFNKGKMK